MGLNEAEARFMADPEVAAEIAGYLADNRRAVALAELREGIVTQKELGAVLGVSQRRVSAIESAHDLQVSTLNSYLTKLGFTLELIARDEAGNETAIQLAD